MTSRRRMILGGQIIVVAVLMAVVYFTFLRSDAANNLFGVDAPQDTPQVAQEPTRPEPDRAADRPSGSVDTPSDAENLIAGSSLAPATPAVTQPEGPSGDEIVLPPDGKPPTGSKPPVLTKPPAHQYADTLARLQAMLNPGNP